MEQWYLAQYKPGKANLEKLQYMLKNRNILSWTPQVFTTKTCGTDNTEKKVLEPLFPGYIFVEFDINKHHPSKLIELPGMGEFVRSCGEFNPVPFSVLDELMSYPIGHRETHWERDLRSKIRLTRRQKIRIKNIMGSEDPTERTAMFLAFTGALFL